MYQGIWSGLRLGVHGTNTDKDTEAVRAKQSLWSALVSKRAYGRCYVDAMVNMYEALSVSEISAAGCSVVFDLAYVSSNFTVCFHRKKHQGGAQSCTTCVPGHMPPL